MRTLTATLLAAQKAASRTPCATLTATNTIHGVRRLTWTRAYTGAEAASNHAAAIAGDGSMTRTRILGADMRYQRIADPEDPLAPWSIWPNSIAGVSPYPHAVAAFGAEVAIFYCDTAATQLLVRISADYGVTYGAPTLLMGGGGAIFRGLAAAYKPNGELAVVLQVNTYLQIMVRRGGVWAAPATFGPPPSTTATAWPLSMTVTGLSLSATS